jgi:hypothetical protein
MGGIFFGQPLIRGGRAPDVSARGRVTAPRTNPVRPHPRLAHLGVLRRPPGRQGFPQFPVVGMGRRTLTPAHESVDAGTVGGVLGRSPGKHRRKRRYEIF